MKRTARLLAGSLAALALTTGVTTAAAATANAALINAIVNGGKWDAYQPTPGAPTAYPGMFIDFSGDLTDGDTTYLEGASCTMGAVGTDAAGRKIGITAGHCNQRPRTINGQQFRYPGPTRGIEVSDQDRDKHPVFDRNASKWAEQHPDEPPAKPIGWIRWVDDDVCEDGETHLNSASGEAPCYAGMPFEMRGADMDSLTDYMVIEFAPEVQLSSQVLNKQGKPVMSTAGGNKPFKVNSIYTGPDGAPAVPGPFSYVEIYGGRTDRMPDPSSSPPVLTTPSNGMVTGVTNGRFRAAAGFWHGDSGGPVVIKGTGKWAGITTMLHIPTLASRLVPWVSTSAKNILDDLNDPNRPGTIGRGFTPINN